MPIEARLSRRPGDEVPWSMETELLARVVEEVSVLAADQRRRKPITVPRPVSAQPEKKTVKRGFAAAVGDAARRGRVRVTPGA